MDNTNHTEPKTTAPMRELTDDELRVVAGGGSVDTLAAASNKPSPGKMSWEHYFAVWHRSCESYPDRASIRYWGKGWTMGRIVFCARHAYLARLDNVTV